MTERPVPPLAVVSGCPRCGGAMRPDLDGRACLACGHREYAPVPHAGGWPSTAVKRGPQAGMRL